MPALVLTSWSFPFTTTLADTTCDRSAGSPTEDQSSAYHVASICCDAVAPSITQTPTSCGGAMPQIQSTAPRSTTTVIPSWSAVTTEGDTRSLAPTAMPSATSRSPTLALIVRTASGRPSSTMRVTLFCTAT